LWNAYANLLRNSCNCIEYGAPLVFTAIPLPLLVDTLDCTLRNSEEPRLSYISTWSNASSLEASNATERTKKVWERKANEMMVCF
jgi:hypothetical protein